jgi:methylenetetrahydrofolate dehydrogenase (NADP+)/methenyltetrahydrofolate cyclohydrolase
MKTRIIKGEELKSEILTEIKAEIESIAKNHNRVPGIAFIGFNDVPLGKYNIPFHQNLANELGFRVHSEVLTYGVDEDQMFSLIDKLNADTEIHAIEVLQPLPEYINPLRIMNRVDPSKEMEGFHPDNMMKVLFPDIQEGGYNMCLPTALALLFQKYRIAPKEDQEWVLILDDEFFNNPLVSMVTKTAITKAIPDSCVLTIVNKTNKNLELCCKRADYLVVVTKDPEFIQPEWLKKGVCVIDIYSNLVKEIPNKNSPDRFIPIIRGGVDVSSVENIASALFPIPGGVMSVVLAVMLRNALNAFKKNLLV